MTADDNGMEMEPRLFRPGEDDAFDALRAELASVSVSPDFSKRVLTTIEAESADALGHELNAIAVSPAFAVRVRTAIEEQSVRRSWFPLNWRWAVPVGAVAAGLVIIAVMLRSNVRQMPVTSVASGGASQTPPAALTMRPSEPMVSSSAPSVARIQARPSNRSQPAVEPAAADPLSQVITDQPDVIRRLWSRVAPDADVVSADPGNTVLMTAGEIVIRPIEVNPIAVVNLGDPAAAASGSTPIIRRATAEQAERSPK
jgi:hypothetical protein